MNDDYERHQTWQNLTGRDGLEEAAELAVLRKKLDSQIGIARRIQVEKEA